MRPPRSSRPTQRRLAAPTAPSAHSCVSFPSLDRTRRANLIPSPVRAHPLQARHAQHRVRSRHVPGRFLRGDHPHRRRQDARAQAQEPRGSAPPRATREGVFAAVKAKFAKSVTFYIAEAEPDPTARRPSSKSTSSTCATATRLTIPPSSTASPSATAPVGPWRSERRSRRHLDDEEHVRRARALSSAACAP